MNKKGVDLFTSGMTGEKINLSPFLFQPKIEDLLGLREGLLGVKRPYLVTSSTLRFSFKKSKNNYHNDSKKQHQNN